MTYGDAGRLLYSQAEFTEHDLDHLVATLGPALRLDPKLVAAAAEGDLLPSTALDVVDLDDEMAVFTPLYLAVALNEDEAVHLLLHAGADPKIGAYPTGHLPADAADLFGRHAMAREIRAR